MSSRGLMSWYFAWMASLGVAFFVFPSQKVAIWAVLCLSSAAALLYGVRKHRPRKPGPWLWLTGGILAFGAGDVAYNVIAAITGDANPFPSLADVFYLVNYVLLIVGVLGLSKAGAASRDRSVALDALIITAGVGLLSWTFLIAPQLANADRPLLERAISIAYPLGDVLLLTMVVRLITVVRASWSVILLVLGAAGALVADTLYGLAQLNQSFSHGGPIHIGWMVFVTAWGAAALHPSMATLTRPRVVRPREMGFVHQAALAVFLLIPLGLFFVHANLHHSPFPVVVAVLLGATFLLVLVRLFAVINAYRRSTERSLGIRHANAALLSATDADGVSAALKLAAEHLLPSGTPYETLLILNDGRSPELFAARPAGGARLCATEDLPAETSSRLGGFEFTLICPLALQDRPSGDPNIGALLVSSEEIWLGFLQLPMEMMATQAALALERIMLTGEIERQNNERYFRTLVHNATDVILIVEPDGDLVRYASPSAETVAGTAQLAGTSLRSLIDTPSHHLTTDLLALSRTADDGSKDAVADWTVLRQDGVGVQVEVSCRDLRADPTVGGLVVTLRDVTDQRNLQAELTHRAFHDSLTGLANRLLFGERLAAAVKQAQQSGLVAGALFIDLDDFKTVNDSFGHNYGDKLLRAVAERLTASVGPHGSAARLGGDEFAALFEGLADAAAIDQMAERVAAALAEPFIIDGRVTSGSACIGAATSDDSSDADDLLRHADLALYVAKKDGTGQWRRYQRAQHTEMVQRLQLRTALADAIAGGSPSAGALSLEFQPIVGFFGGAIAGFEALVRWDHPIRGRLLPDQFIDVAEESGLIVPMGNRVLRDACAEAARWAATAGGRESPYVSINVSARQFREPGFVPSVRSALEEANLPADRLMLELTESLLLRDDDQIWVDLVELRRTGVKVAIDDFGTGYSSLSYLRHIPLDALKIDRLFTNTIVSSRKQAALVNGIISLAQTLGLEVIAEGVERSTERDMLARFGCRYGQGFYFARPLTAADALARVRSGAGLNGRPGQRYSVGVVARNRAD